MNRKIKDQHLSDLKGGGGKEINTFIYQGWFKLIKSDDNNVYNVTKYFYFR